MIADNKTIYFVLGDLDTPELPAPPQSDEAKKTLLQAFVSLFKDFLGESAGNLTDETIKTLSHLQLQEFAAQINQEMAAKPELAEQYARVNDFERIATKWREMAMASGSPDARAVIFHCNAIIAQREEAIALLQQTNLDASAKFRAMKLLGAAAGNIMLIMEISGALQAGATEPDVMAKKLFGIALGTTAGNLMLGAFGGISAVLAAPVGTIIAVAATVLVAAYAAEKIGEFIWEEFISDNLWAALETAGFKDEVEYAISKVGQWVGVIAPGEPEPPYKTEQVFGGEVIASNEKENIVVGNDGRNEIVMLHGRTVAYGKGGNDIYRVHTTARGNQVISDGDGDNSLIFGIEDIATLDLVKVGDNVYRSAGGNYTVTRVGDGDSASLVISSKYYEATVTILSWTNGDFGINLPGEPEPEEPTSVNQPGTEQADYISPYLAGSPGGGNHAVGSGGRDMIWGTGVDLEDVLEGGDGSDIINGNGKDRIDGGAGDDFISSFGDESVVHGGEGNDAIAADFHYGFSFGVAESFIDHNAIWRDVQTYFNWQQPAAFYKDDEGRLSLGYGMDLAGQFDYSGASVVAGWTYHFHSTGAGQFELVYYSASAPEGKHVLSGGTITFVGTEPVVKGVSLYGDAGNDTITGSTADDLIDGGEDNDLLSGGAGNDVVVGGSGDDGAAGGEGNDVLDGGEGNDSIVGESGNDTIAGGIGDDLLWGDAHGPGDSTEGGDDSLNGGAGNDQLVGDGGNDLLDGNVGNDRLFGGAGDDTLLGGGGEDQLQGGAGHDLLSGDSEKDVLFGEEGNDSLVGGGGDDELQGGIGDDHLDGGHDNDLLFGQEGHDALVGGAGDDELQGGDGNDSLAGGDGVDRLYGQAGNDHLSGGPGDDVLSGGDGQDSLSGGDGVDTLVGGAENDRLSGGAGVDTLYGDDGDDTLDGGGENDTLYSGNGNDSAYGDAGNDVMYGQAGEDRLEGGAGDDTIYGNEDNDTLVGGEGADFLRGGDGDDTLEGGAGDDGLNGGFGANTYIVGPDTGNDIIYIPATSPAEGAWSGDLRITGGIQPGDVGVVIDGSNVTLSFGASSVIIGGFMSQYDASLGGEWFQGLSPVTSMTFDNGTVWTISDIKRAYLATAFTSGDDTITGYEGNDTIRGGDGNDSLSGWDGNDTLQGDAGNDRLDGGLGDDVLLGGTGADTLVGDYGNDRLSGGTGNDTLQGQAHSDTYEFAAGDGQDTIDDNGIDGTDVLEFAEGITPESVEVVRDGLDLYLRIQGTSDQIKVLNVFQNDGQSALGLDEVRFADGSVWTRADLLAKVLLGGDGNDLLTGYASNDLLVGAGGGDTMDGGSGNDVLDGGADADSLSGGDGNDDLAGGLGSDILAGGDGDDTYRYSAGDGSDTIADDSGVSTLVLSGGTPSDAYFRRDGENLVLYFRGRPADQLTFAAWFDPATGLARRGLVVDYGDGVPISLDAAALDLEVMKAGDADDVIHGNDAANIISGLGGDDIIRAGGGDDIVLGGDGADQIFGGAGNDDLSGGDGEDRLEGGADNDRLAGDAGNDHLFGQAGDDTMFGGVGGDRLEGGDGIDHLYGEADNDVLSGQAGNDMMAGGAGDDELEGGIGDDQLDGGDGADRLSGSEGADVLVGGLGNDTVDGGSGADQLAGGGGDDIYLVDDSGDVVIEEATGGADLIRSSVSYSLAEHVELLELTGSGAIDATGNAAANHLLGNQAANRLDGLAGDDTLEGQGGNDELLGGGGHDRLDGGYGLDRLAGGAGNDTYIVDDANDTIVESAQEGVDTVIARSDYTLSDHVETLVLDEGSGARAGSGNAGDNLIVGNTASNRLDGAAGADRLEGGAGNDTYVVDNVGDEVVELADEGEDTVESGIDYTLGGTLENLILTGGADLDGTGNDGENVLVGNSGSNRIDGGLGGDQMHGGAGDDYFVNESNQDWIFENEGEGADTVERRYETNLVLSGNVENLILAETVKTGNGNELDNTITGNASANTLGGWDGDDVLNGLDGDDSLFGGTGSDALRGGSGNDYLDGGEGFDNLEGGVGNDVYITDDAGDIVAELVDGGTDKVQSTATYTLSANIEQLFLMGGNAIDGAGNALDNYLSGNEAANVLRGHGGNDTIYGKGGSDTVIGGAGDDMVVVAVGSGTDVVDNTGGGFDGLFLEGSVGRERLSFSRDGNDLLITVDNAATPVARILNHFLGGDAAIDYVQPGDQGPYLTAAQINQIVAGGGTGYDQVIDGTAVAEQLVGSTGKDLIRGFAGGDQLFGMDGNDTLQGGDGDDYLAGGNGSAAGSGDDRLEGGVGNDTLRGQDGSNTLIGGLGNDTYVYGGGQDVVDNVGGGTDRIFFENGITASQLAFSRTGDDLVITVNGNASNTVRVTGHFLGGDQALDFVHPATGSALDTAAINALVGGSNPGGGDGDYPSVIDGTAAGEQLLGSDDRDLIRALGGNDLVFAFEGDDKVEGGDGDDNLYGGNGTFSASGNDILIGGAGADTLYGEDGADQLFGGAGDDTYYFSEDSGSDVIEVGGGSDWIYMAGIARDRLTFHRDVDDLIVRVDGDAALQLRVVKHFQGGQYALAFVQPGDGGYAIPASDFEDMLELLQPASASLALASAEDGPAIASKFSTFTATDPGEAVGALIADMASSAWREPLRLDPFDAWQQTPGEATAQSGASQEVSSLIEAMGSFANASTAWTSYADDAGPRHEGYANWTADWQRRDGHHRLHIRYMER